jgi:phosphoribosylformylglycinamidine synthase
MQYKIQIMLKPGILDPQGEAISNALTMSDFVGFKNVRQGKIIIIDIDGTNKEKALLKITAMCEKLLANTVIENYQIEES